MPDWSSDPTRHPATRRLARAPLMGPRTVTLAVTVLGPDRPGIIAEATGILAEAGMNLEDSTMTLLRGHFAMTLICAGEADSASVQSALQPLVAGGLTVRVQEVADGLVGPPPEDTLLVTVHGADRLGIVSRLAGVIAAAGGNITDLTTRLAGELYVLAAEVDLAAGTDVATLTTQITTAARAMGVDATVRAVDRDDL